MQRVIPSDVTSPTDRLTDATQLEDRSKPEYWQWRLKEYGVTDAANAPFTADVEKQRAATFQLLILHHLLQMPNYGRVLEIGCGQGRLAWIPLLAKSYVGIDFTPQMVSMAAKRYPQYHYEVQDVRRMRFQGELFDIAIAVDCASSLAWKFDEEVLPEVCRVLKGDGLFILAENNYVRVHWKQPGNMLPGLCIIPPKEE